jgi:hypothetical protein
MLINSELNDEEIRLLLEQVMPNGIGISEAFESGGAHC